VRDRNPGRRLLAARCSGAVVAKAVSPGSGGAVFPRPPPPPVAVRDAAATVRAGDLR